MLSLGKQSMFETGDILKLSVISHEHFEVRVEFTLQSQVSELFDPPDRFY